jgi:hypothetical protein
MRKKAGEYSCNHRWHVTKPIIDQGRAVCLPFHDESSMGCRSNAPILPPNILFVCAGEVRRSYEFG